jgi:hypothetical protein
MAWYRCRAWVGLKLAASICTGIGLAGLLPGWPVDGASAKSRRDAPADGTVTARAAGTPVMAIVSLRQQRVTIYDPDGPILQAPVSTGQTGYETPAGIYTVLEKQAEHYSNIYDDASMPYMQRLTWSGIALHAGVLPGYPASHGCIRMPHGFAERLFERTKVGMRVIIARDDVRPADFTHPALFKPFQGAAAAPEGAVSPARLADASAADGAPARPRMSFKAVAAAKSAAAAEAAKKAEEARMAARSATIEAARASTALRRAEGAKVRAELQLRQAERAAGANGMASERAQQVKAAALAALGTAQAQLERTKAEVQPKVDLALQLRERSKEAQEASVAAQDEAKEAVRKLAPVSVFISRAAQRLYVRQAREPLFDAPVAIAEPERPLGTYVFTALAYAGGESDLRWSVVSMYRAGSGPATEAGKRRDPARQAEAAGSDHAGAKLALDRITIPREAAERISEVVSPGSSLIVSDETLSRETGKATEFIVLMSGEPQGGIKIRRRSTPPAEVRYRYQRPYYGGSPLGWSGPSFWWQ